MSDSNEVAVTRARLSNDELRAIESTKDVLSLFKDKGQELTDLSKVLGSGFDVLETKNKGKLIGVGFLILEWHFSDGDKGEFVSLTIVTEDNRKLILNDGSTGIRAQVHDLEARGIFAPVLVRRGLRVSEYFYDPSSPMTKSNKQEAPDWERAETFYLAV